MSLTESEENEQGMRLDAALVARGLVTGREQAKGRIRAGEVFLNGRAVLKAAAAVYPHDTVTCEGEAPRYVGRGGYKLEKALRIGKYDLNGVRAMDIGASTGGFTDCMLQHGAAEVFSIDVGHGQLHPKFAADARVHNLEGTDVRDTDRLRSLIEPASIGFCSIDVSFISVKKIFSTVPPFLIPRAPIVCLIKPQFEAGRQAIGKNGVVKDSGVHRAVLNELCAFFVSSGCALRRLDFSPVTGGEGNIEYLALLEYGGDSVPVMDAATVVAEAHKVLR